MSDAQAYPFGPVEEGLVPHPEYARLRAEPGLARIRMPYGGEAWLATRYDDARQVLADPRFSRAAAAGRDSPRARPLIDEPESMLSMDPPEHTRLRRLVAKAFTARRVELLRPWVVQVVDELLDAMTDAGPPADFVELVAWPTPMIVISELLGVPADDRADLRRWTERTLALGAGTSVEQITDARIRLMDYLAGLAAERRRHPSDDLVGALVVARDEGDALSEDELVRLLLTLLVAGHETTANQIGNFAYLLLSEAERWSRLVEAGPSAVPAAVEELLRYTPMALSVDFARVATEDVEVGGQVVPAGDAVLVQLHSADRDTAVFPDGGELDLTRDPNPHIAFGHGAHHCLGAPLARLELHVIFEALVRRLPGLRLAREVEWVSDRLLRGARGLNVAW
ncbi:cytochrome P450 [Kibdelosporangium banguiense]|uniref:Cytochrome P450 n=1 Tax=Kibdelosporangium banguiense TaxID=1365924 RepID=A0ABS4TQC1_9PSEU|nr:cytochrome P450 [Kibdelosporangium banguiense]MBP2326598.1 cytochrome P450 [Kibdelosporangium banguiense]